LRPAQTQKLVAAVAFLHLLALAALLCRLDLFYKQKLADPHQSLFAGDELGPVADDNRQGPEILGGATQLVNAISQQVKDS